MVSAVTRWFSIDEDGQPQLPGWYESAYSWEKGDHAPTMLYWDGKYWLEEPGRMPLSFGNEDTAGERWRGLAQKPVEYEDALKYVAAA